MRQCALRRVLAAIALVAGAGRGLGQSAPVSLQGSLRDGQGKPLAGAVIELGLKKAGAGTQVKAFVTDSGGAFRLERLAAGKYTLSVGWCGNTTTLKTPLEIREGKTADARLDLVMDHGTIELRQPSAGGPSAALPPTAGQSPATAPPAPVSSPALVEPEGNGAQLSSKQVSSLPLNKRDFTQLLTLGAGTTTDTNGAANFTQQFSVNGQRGTSSVFAIDSIYATDPELGGPTFANFNVDAIQEIRSDSGVMPAEVGAGAAGFTNVITQSGTRALHGSVFEFVRNAAFDARNFFDRRSAADTGRIPPFVRNEFGFTVGGPVLLPHLYQGGQRTFFFGQYQGFRQVLGTTQVLSVPTLQERHGMDTTAFPGDTLIVPVSPAIAPVLARYPLPNDPLGPYGARTFATSSKVATISNQFSIRLDHRLSDQASLFARFNLDNITGPTSNPSQTAIDPSFGIGFFNHERNLGLTYTRIVSPKLTSESSFGVLRTTPFFTTTNHSQPAIDFADGLYEPFNSAAGQYVGDYGNLIQLRQNFSYSRGAHALKTGLEVRLNRDTTIFGLSPNGVYAFGGGTAYAPVAIPSATDLHNILPGDPLPDSLTGFLTATPFSYNAETAGNSEFPQGDHVGESAVRREAYNFYVQDAWKVSPHLTLNYGLRYEVNTRIREAKHRTSNIYIFGPNGQSAPYWESGVRQRFLFNPQPPYDMDWGGWGPRLSAALQVSKNTTLHAGGAINTTLPNIINDNNITASFPFVVNPYFTALPGAPVPFKNSVIRFAFPAVVTPQGQPVFATGRTTDVPANTEIDLVRFEQDLAAVTLGNQIQALQIFGMSKNFSNGYVEAWTAGVEHSFGDLDFSAAYVGTAGVKIPSLVFPNDYPGAAPAFAPFTLFDAQGRVRGGIGTEFLTSNRSHSVFHSLQTSLSKTSPRAGIGFQVNYTLSKSLDDTSSVYGAFGQTTSGTLLQAFPQNPWNPGAEKGPSTFDTRHILTINVIQALPFDRLDFLRRLRRHVTSGWELLNISTLTSGSPFTIYSGVQQSGAGSLNTDRPDQMGQPVLSTSRPVREDYFGQGSNNAAFFFIPISVPGGTGPNQGRFGTLGRNTFYGPGFHSFDVSLIKDTPLGHRGASEAATLEFRGEFFNVFNLVNFGLPANIVRGTGFGMISHTAGPSRQLQFSLKLIY